MCLNVEFQLPLLLTGITMVSYSKAPWGTKVVDKLHLDCKVKVKFSLCLISQALCHDDVWGTGSIALLFLTLSLDGIMWSVSCLCHFILGKGPQHPLDWKLGGPQSKSGHFWKRNVSCPFQETDQNYLAIHPIAHTISVELQSESKWCVVHRRKFLLSVTCLISIKRNED
jgi:hypothetical protein